MNEQYSAAAPLKPGTTRAMFHPAIEGMRAIAVLSVVLAHAHVPGFAGGFVGVDVFFVISGFLICRMLFSEMADAGRIGLVRFWARRVRRLLPNATLTLLATLAIGLFIIPGFMRSDVARDVTMSALQISNYHFASSAVDYFRQDDPQSPVLHFWSLAVEEQFYIVWPALLALLCVLLGRRAGLVSRYLLVVIAVASFAGMMYALTISQPMAFFHSWARAWQLGIGGLVAVAFNAGWSMPGSKAGDFGGVTTIIQALGWAGIASILASVHLLDPYALYPGWAALLPTLGSAAMISAVTLAPARTWSIAAPLSTGVLRWFGARSYSWYLWHWPILILAEFAYPEMPAVRAAGAMAALVIASVVYSHIEVPMRRGQRLMASPGRTVLAGLASIVVLVIAAAGFARLPAPGGAEAQGRDRRMKAAASDIGAVYKDKCHLDVEISHQPACEYGVASSRHRVVLFGDSHAAQWASGVQKAALDEGWSLRSWTKSACPSIDIKLWYPARRTVFHECSLWRERVMAELTGPDRPDVVIISNHQEYTRWIEGPDTPGKLVGRAEALRLVSAGTKRVVDRLLNAGVGVILVRDTPRMIRSIAPCFVRGGGSVCDLTRERALQRPWLDVEVAGAFQNADKFRFLDLTDQICEEQVCRIERNGELVWRDSHHVRSSFAFQQSDHFRRLLQSFQPKAPKGE